MNEIHVIRPSYQGQRLLDFIYSTKDEPDDTLVEFTGLPYMQRGDGSYGPPLISLARIREEFLIRAAFPHEAQTYVW